MTTALPPTGAAPVPERRCDTDDMKIVHGLLRLLFRQAPELVRAVAPGQARRQRAVANHVAMISTMLHGHHRTEDTLLWDVLEQRTPACALHVGRMRSQHDDMARMLTDLDARVAEWNRVGGADDQGVAHLLDQVLSVLDTHLGAEETVILPVAQVSMSQKEWDLLGETSREHTPKDVMFVQLGYLRESFPAESRDDMVRQLLPLPLPVRLLWKLVGKRQYARYLAELHVDA